MYGTQREHFQHSQELFLIEIHQLTAPPCSESVVFLFPTEMHVCLSPNFSESLKIEEWIQGEPKPFYVFICKNQIQLFSYIL